MGFSDTNNPIFNANVTNSNLVDWVNYRAELYAGQANGSCPIADQFFIPFPTQAEDLVAVGECRIPTMVNNGFCLNAYFLIRDLSNNSIISDSRADASRV